MVVATSLVEQLNEKAGRPRALWLVALLLSGCGGGSTPAPPPGPGVLRLSQGFHRNFDGTDVGVMQVLVKARPQKALVSLIDATQPGSRAQRVELTVGESTLIGARRVVLVAAGKGDKRAYVDFRLGSVGTPGGGTTSSSTPPPSPPPQG